MTRLPAVILLLVTIAFGLAPFVTPPFTGYDPSMFPVQIGRPAIQPAAYAFAIWSVIYVWLIIHAVYRLWKRAEDPSWEPSRLPLTVAIAVGVVWLWIAGQSAIWGTMTIWIMAVAALAAFLRTPTEPDRWLLSGPIAIFAGWLTAAAAVSTGVLLAGYGVLSNNGSALAMLALVLIIALAVQARKPRMPVYGLTVIWALVGVIVVNLADNALVAGVATAGVLVMLGALIWNWRKV